MAEPARKIYDDQAPPDDFTPRPKLDVVEGGGETSEPRRGHLRSVDDEDEGLAGSEESAATSKPKASRSEATEKAAVNKASGDGDLEDDQFFKGEEGEKNGKRRRWRRRAVVGGGIAGALGGGTITLMFIFSSGPLQFLHFAQILQQFHFGNSDSFTNGRAAQLIEYARTRNEPERRNLNYFGDRIADHYSTRLRDAGIEFEYNNRARVAAVIVDPDTPEGERTIAELEGQEFTTETVDTDNGPRTRVELTGERARVRRAAITVAVDSIGMNKVSNAIAGRLLKIRAGVNLHPLRNIARAADERLFDYIDKVRQDQSDYIGEGDDTELRVNADDDADGTSGDEPDTTDQTDIDAAANEGNATIDEGGSVSTRASRLRTSLAAGAGIAGFASLTCGLQQIGNQAAALQTSNIVRPLIRNGMQVISVGSQIQTGQDVNLDELGALSHSLYDSVGRTSWAQAQSIQEEMGNFGAGVAMDTAAIPGTAKPLFFGQLDAVLGLIPGVGAVCSAVTSTAGNIILTIGGVALGASGPFGIILNAGSEAAQAILTGAFLDDLVQWIAGEQVDTSVAGAMFGNYANFGAFLANNDRMWSLGGRLLSGTESGQLDEMRVNEQRREFKQKSFYARVFDLKEPNSVAAKTLLENPTFASTSNMTSSVAQMPIRSVSSVFSNLSSVFTPRSMAQSSSTEDRYGVPEVGFSVDELNSEIAEDPYENASFVEANIEHLNDTYGDCFNTTIDPETGTIQTSDVASYIDRSDECDSNSEELLRFRFYLADMTIAQSLTCYAGVDEETCENLGFEVPAEESTGGTLPEGVVGIEDIVDIPPWLGLGRGCHESIADRTRQMLEAASSDGVELRGNCWRSSEVQMQLRQQNCPDPINSPASACSPPTARVGSSNHERGLAIDFSNCSRGSACFNWLSANAARYGFSNLPSESWHWSVDGR